MRTISEQTLDLVQETLIATLGPYYDGFSIGPNRRDHDGDPALFVVARFDPPNALPPSRTMIDAMVALRDRLLAIGDERLHYVDFLYPEDVPFSDEAA